MRVDAQNGALRQNGHGSSAGTGGGVASGFMTIFLSHAAVFVYGDPGDFNR